MTDNVAVQYNEISDVVKKGVEQMTMPLILTGEQQMHLSSTTIYMIAVRDYYSVEYSTIQV